MNPIITIAIAIIMTLMLSITVNAYAIHEGPYPNTPKNNSTFELGHRCCDYSDQGNSYQGSPNDLNADGLLDHPYEKQKGPDPTCGIMETLQNGPMASLFKGRFDKYNERCGFSSSSSSGSLDDIIKQGQDGREMLSCVKKSHYNTFVSDNDKEECDNLILSIKSQCEDDNSLVFCVVTDSGFDPVKNYMKENNLDTSEDNDNEDNEDKEEEKEDN